MNIAAMNISVQLFMWIDMFWFFFFKFYLFIFGCTRSLLLHVGFL